MASVTRKERSPYWFACFTDATGRRTTRSTGETNERKARVIAEKYGETAREARQGRLSEHRVRKVVSDLFVQVGGRPVSFYTVESWLRGWIENVKGTTAPRTIERYSSTVESFLKHLGVRAGIALEMLAEADVRGWRESLQTRGKSASTTNQERKIIGVALRAAQLAGAIPFNPAATVKNLRDAARGAKREAFTAEQVRALVAATVGTEWEGLILIGATTGLRLRDGADLAWRDVDLDRGFLKVLTGKTETMVEIPIHRDLAAWLKSQPRGVGKAPVLPSLHGKSGGGKSGLSMKFARILKGAKILGRMVREGKGEGRTTHSLSFHSLRHYFVSQLAAHGVAADVRKRLAGHSDAKTHAVYSAHELTSLRLAVDALPRLSA